MSGPHQKWEMPSYVCKLNSLDLMADHNIQKLTLVREGGKLPAVHGVSKSVAFLLSLVFGTTAGRCNPHPCKACARTVQHTRAKSTGSVWCWGCMMLQCTEMNLILGEKSYTLYSESSHNMLLRRTIIRTQHLVEGGTQLLFFFSLSKTAALILFWHHF